MTIAITGATGRLGRLVVARLKDRVAADIVALARRPAKAAGLGVAVREADYLKPETLAAAFAGVHTLLLISSSSEIARRIAEHRNVIAAARRAGVQRIVYTSLLHADTSAFDLAAGHVVTEDDLKASGIAFTILRNGWYTENYTGLIGGAVARGAFVGGAGDGRISSASRTDYADAAVAVLTGEGHRGKTYELAGDEAYTLSGLAAELSRQASRAIPYKNMPEVEHAAALAGVGLPEALARAIARWDVGASKGALFDDRRELSALIGRPTTTLAVAVSDALEALSAYDCAG